MNFFAHQEQARKKTKLLVFLFLCAVVSMTYTIYAIAMVVFRRDEYGQVQLSNVLDYNPKMLMWVSLAVGLCILGGYLYRRSTLSQGGASVALLLGGRRVHPDTKQFEERRLLNVVEEMAIASGTPVPQVYLLANDLRINAFAAGTTPSNAVIGVTKGALQQLNRDELQGVIAHEFSHILNGDMKLNIDLISVIAGITVLNTISRQVLRSPRSGRSNNKNKGGGPILLFALGVFLVSLIGQFFANLIRAAVSREREFLADASSVQFTRNPIGIAGALYKASGSSYMVMSNAFASEASHLFFDSPKRNFGGAFSTHPKLEDRIKRVYPSFQPSLLTVEDSGTAVSTTQNKNVETQKKSFQLNTESLLNEFGTLNLNHLSMAALIIETTPASLIEAAHSDEDCQYVVYALIANSQTTQGVAFEKATRLVESLHGLTGKEKFLQIGNLISNMDEKFRLPLLEMTLPAMRQIPEPEFQKYLELIKALVLIGNGNLIFESAVERLVEKCRDVSLKTNARFYSLETLREDALYILALSSTVGAPDRAAAQVSATAALSFIKSNTKINWPATLAPQNTNAQRFNFAIRRLEKLRPNEKQALLGACSIAISNDGKLTVSEMELLRTLSLVLDTPMPLQ